MIIWMQKDGILAVNSGNNSNVVPKDTDYKKVISLPKSHTFRNAWTFEDIVGVDIDKAIVITKERIRAWRDPQFKSLDVEFMRATESGASTDDIVAHKQILRDATDNADGKNIDELTQIVELLDNDISEFN